MATKTLTQNRQTKPAVKAQVMTVSPALAAEWLTKNERNRKPRASLIERYARDMVAGQWLLTGEAIKFDTNGLLVDGQHRLLAVIKAETSVEILVISGVATEVQDVLDTGGGRTAADALTLNGHGYASTLASAARLAINWERGNIVKAHMGFGTLDAVSHSEVLQFVRDNPDFESIAPLAAKWRRIPARKSTILFAAWLCWLIDDQATVGYFDDLAESRTSGIGDPRQAVLSRLYNAVKDHERMSPVTQADLIFRGWNAIRAGRTLSKVSPRATSGSNFTDPR